MRCFAIIAAACLLASGTSAWNVHEATDCVSHRMSLVLGESYVKMSGWIKELEPEGQELVQEVRAKLNNLHDDLDAEIDRALSKIDSDCGKQNPTEKTECLKREMTTAATAAVTNAVNGAAGILKDHAEAFGPDRVEPMKDLADVMMRDIPISERAINGCFYNIYRDV